MKCFLWPPVIWWLMGTWCCQGLPLLTGPKPVHKHQLRSKTLLQQSNITRFQKPYNICTSDWAPIVVCADINDPKDYSGFQIALWRKIAQDMGWSDEDWTFSCVDWTAMIADLLQPDGLCSFAAAGVEVSLSNVIAGLKFSWPIYKSGFQVLIASSVEQGSMWAFAEVFSWSVWVLLGATAIIVSLLVTVVELFTPGNQANRKGLRGWSWYAMGKMVQVPTHVGDPRTWASRTLVLAYAFLVLIIVHLFTATTASKMTMQRLANDITSKADLPGKKVQSWEPYIPLLRKYSIDADAQPWDNDADTHAMLDNLRTHAYQALVLDAPVVQYLAATSERCDLYPVGDPFETFNLAIAFPPNAPDQLAANISASIVRLQTTTAVLDRLENEYVKSAHAEKAGNTGKSAGCANVHTHSSTSHAADPQIQLHQVLGLWYILLITLGIATVIVTVQMLIYKRQKLQDWFNGVAGSKSGKVAAGDVLLRPVCVDASGADDTIQSDDHCSADIRTCSVSDKQVVGGETATTGQARQPAGLLVGEHQTAGLLVEHTLIQSYDAQLSETGGTSK